MADSKGLEGLERLGPDARMRVEAALKAKIEAELANDAGRVGGLEAREFSRGIIFSRSRGRLDASLEDETILRGAIQMDEQTFANFSERLATLKRLKSAVRQGE